MTDTSTRGATRTRLLALVAALLLLAALYFLRPVVMPLVIGVLLAAFAWPLLHRLERHVPRPIALLVTVLAIVAGLLALLGALGGSAALVGERVREQPERVATLRARVEPHARRLGIQLPDAPTPVAPGVPDAGEPSRNSLGSRYGRRFISGIWSTAAALGLAVGFAALMLSELERVRVRVRKRLAPGHADRLLAVTAEVAHGLRRFALVKTLTSGITGIATGVITAAFGVELALVWGFLAFLLEYVPAIGSLVAVIPPVVYAFMQFDDPVRAFALLGTLTVAQLVLGNYVDPKIEGSRLSLSPVVVLFAVVFWTWMWGAAGSFLGVPITLALITIAGRFEGTRPVWAVLSGDEAER